LIDLFLDVSGNISIPAVLAGTQLLVENKNDYAAAIAVADKYYAASISKTLYSVNAVLPRPRSCRSRRVCAWDRMVVVHR
jgi:hypothetical protein